MRSLSNMIKGYSVRDEEIKMTIDTHLRIDKEIEQKKKVMITTDRAIGEFSQGIKAIVIEQIPSQQEQTEKASQLIEDAKKEAGQILSQSKQEAEKIKKDAFAEAQKKGYEQGILQCSCESQKIAAEFEEKTKMLQKEYDTSLSEFEPKMVKIISSIIEKITGILVEDKEEVILYIVGRALKDMDTSKEYTIRVAKENYEYLTERKNILLNAIGREATIYITELPSLRRNQCIIETDLRVIDCSLDVQLNNLIMDLKLLASV